MCVVAVETTATTYAPATTTTTQSLTTATQTPQAAPVGASMAVSARLTTGRNAKGDSGTYANNDPAKRHA